MKYRHTPPDLGEITALQWTGDNLKELSETFPEIMFTKYETSDTLKYAEPDSAFENHIFEGSYFLRFENPLPEWQSKYGTHPAESFLNYHTLVSEIQPKEAAEMSYEDKLAWATAFVEKHRAENPAYVAYPNPKRMKSTSGIEPMLLVLEDSGYFQLVHNDRIIPYNRSIEIVDSCEAATEIKATFIVNTGKKV